MKGPLPFARFMEHCLYHPRYGYYASGRGCRGREGDYYTSPTVHPIFGALMGTQLAQMWQVLGADAFEVVEMGGGEGYLCLDILDYLQHEEPQFYDLLRYCMVEVSPVMIERQRRLLALHEATVAWYRPDEMAGRKIQGCFLSNELVDSFPVHRVVMEAGVLREIFVDLDTGGIKEVQGDPSTPELVAYFRRLGITLAEGQQAEVNLEALGWLQRVAQGLERGFVITIDYGYPAEELYSPLRPAGTLLCYQGHRAFSDPYARLGLQDMTAHVDFTSLIACGEGYGLELTGLVPQYRFLLALGILEQAAELGKDKGEGEALNERLIVKNLILPGGMGETFKVLIQHKGIAKPQLEGLKGTVGGEQWSMKRSSGL
ncbi:MAG: SAM-dependent methyltransferase [Desulfobacterales bacterium]|nr:SAM-dependent methyltransferase [Desulfobacterales bacterium]